MTDLATKELLNKVQASIVDIISKGLDAGTISEDRAKDIAQMVLKKLPEDISYQELMHVIPKLDDDFQELSSAVVPIMLEYEKKMKAIINERITSLLQNKKFNEALEIARKAIDFEKGLS